MISNPGLKLWLRAGDLHYVNAKCRDGRIRRLQLVSLYFSVSLVIGIIMIAMRF